MRQEKLSEILEIFIGRTPSRDKPDYWGNGHRWVSIRDLSSKTVTETKEQITDLAVKEARCKIVRKGTLLFSFKLTIGKMAFAGCDLFTNEAIAAFSIKDERKLNSQFLYFALQSATYGGSNQAAMGKTLNSKSLAEIEIPLPPLDDQIRIAQLLGKVEGLIAQRKQHLQQLDDLLKSVFLEMFGNPVRNEKGWDKPELKAFGKISTGNTPPRNAPANYDDDFIEWIKTDNITGDAVFVTPSTEHLSEVGARKARTVTNGALLVACIAGSVESIGRAALTDRMVSFNQQINAIQPGKDVSSFYLYGLFKLSRAYIQSHATKGMKKILTKGDFEKITMIKPPFEIQNQFAVIAEKVEGIKSRYQQSLADLETLYGALSQQAFKGELDLSRVPMPEKEIERHTEEASATQSDEPQTTRIELPDLPAGMSLSIDRLREEALCYWFEAYWTSLPQGSTFKTSGLIDAINFRLIVMDDQDRELDKHDHEILKTWVFECLDSGRLSQSYDNTQNTVVLRRASSTPQRN
jgi:type I restriction enzyme S subunit